MIIKGVLLGTIREQIEGGDPNPIDPNLVRLGDNVRVSIGFDSSRVVGRTTKVWRESGRIHFTADVDDLKDFTVHVPKKGPVLVDRGAIGIVTSAELAYELEMKDSAKTTVKGGKLFEVGLTNDNENRNQPPFEVVPDATV